MAVKLKDLTPETQRKVARTAGIRATVPKERVVRLAAEALRAVSASEEAVSTQRRALALALKWIQR